MLSIAALLILGSYIVVTVFSIWHPPADILIPIKLSLTLGYLLSTIYLITEVVRCYRSRSWLGLIFSVLFVALFVGSFLGFFHSVVTFIFNMSVPTNLYFLTMDIKLLATFGLLMALAFIVYSIYHFVLDRVLWAGIHHSVNSFVRGLEQHKLEWWPNKHSKQS